MSKYLPVADPQSEGDEELAAWGGNSTVLSRQTSVETHLSASLFRRRRKKIWGFL